MEDIAQLIPERGVLRDYLDFSVPLSGAPAEYHLFAGLLVIASALGNRVYIPFGAQRICAHLWVALLGPCPWQRAGSIEIARRILDRLEEPPFVGEPISVSRVRRALVGSGSALVIWPDLGEALRDLRWRSLTGLKSFLAEIFDARTNYQWDLPAPFPDRVGGGQAGRFRGRDRSVKAPALSILSGCNSEGLGLRMQEEEMWGLLPRFIFVPAASRGEGVTLPPEPNAELEDRVVSSLGELAQLTGPADFSRVRADYAMWCRDHEGESQGVLYPFLVHYPLYFLKLALIYQLTLAPGLKISGEAFAWAARCLEWLKAAVREVVARDLVFGEARKKRKILRLIEMLPGIAHARLLRHSHMRADQLRRYVETLREEGSIEVAEGRYYPRDLLEDSQLSCERPKPELTGL